jgi:uncharacterized metal-binding protein
MEKERCHGCDKWFAQIEQHLTYHNHFRSVMLEHACQQRLIVECRNCNNGMDPLIGTIVVASAHEVDDGIFTGMSTRRAKRQRCFEQEDHGPPSNTYQQLPLTLDITTCLSCFQARVVVIMEKERCHGYDKWFARIEQHLTYHNHCRSVMLEHACQQRLIVKCRNHNNGMDTLIGTIVVASAHEVDDGMSTGMSTRRAKRQRCFEQEDDNQSNITVEGMDVVDDFCPMIPSPSGEVDPMEADFHSRGSISAVHELEVAAWQSWSASSFGRAAISAGRFYTSIQQDSATRNSHIFAC